MTEWRPIETAPKDGQELILSGKGTGTFAGFWHDGQENYWKLAGWYEESARSRLLTAKPYPASHWMPLPAPPS